MGYRRLLRFSAKLFIFQKIPNNRFVVLKGAFLIQLENERQNSPFRQGHLLLGGILIWWWRHRNLLLTAAVSLFQSDRAENQERKGIHGHMTTFI
tara:strand:+ start:43 stop:327 length:285 start_codon:yes stop_codon:yes gene_type:complete